MSTVKENKTMFHSTSYDSCPYPFPQAVSICYPCRSVSALNPPTLTVSDAGQKLSYTDRANQRGNEDRIDDIRTVHPSAIRE